MITLIGTRCKHSNVLSRGVLIRPFLLGNLEIAIRIYANQNECNESIRVIRFHS